MLPPKSNSLRAALSSTLRLPKSSLPPRPQLPSPYLARCTDELYAWQSSLSQRKPFVLHDGPPYANGSLHIGHALNKVLKDIVCRFQISQGKRVQYIPGWDCHGLPIEVKALQALHKTHESLGPVAVRQVARALAEKTVDEQKQGFKQWAVLGDWDQAYRTMDTDYILRQLDVFKAMVSRNLISRELKPIYWSPSSGTALAEAELEYDEAHTSTAAFIRFPLAQIPQRLEGMAEIDKSQLGVLIWTTTPWTLPANQAVAVHRDHQYCVARVASSPNSLFILGQSRVDHLQSMLGEKVDVLVDSLPGLDIAEQTTYSNPLDQQTQRPIIHADFVSEDSGTGLVHLAPGHGMDDYIVCQPRGLPIHAPVDDRGNFTADVLPGSLAKTLRGKSVLQEGIPAVLELLRNIPGMQKEQSNFVIGTHSLTHSYPIDWRTKQPIVIRATHQWFADVGRIKSDAMKALEPVKFVPEAGRTRLSSFIQSRSQWCISRQRAWGVPIPALYRPVGDGREALMDPHTIDHIVGVIKERGIDAWWTDLEDDQAWVPKDLRDRGYVRGKDTLDVWFDSGTSWTLLDNHSKTQSPADVYLEGSDQHRGWFQSSLLTYVASGQVDGAKAPFKTLITHGFILDQDGKKMSKSLGNVVHPDEIMNGTLLPPVKRKKKRASLESEKPSYDALGPDALRLWVASSDYSRDIAVGQQVLQSVNQALHKYRVTFKWLLGVLSDYDCNRRIDPDTNDHKLIDSVAHSQLAEIAKFTHSSYAAYEFFKGMSSLNRYVNTDLSGFYFETLKDRLYTGTASERAFAQQALYPIFTELLYMLAPITPLMVEEVWKHTPAHLKSALHPLKSSWTPFESGVTRNEQTDLRATTQSLLSVHAAIKIAQEDRRASKKMGSSLECDAHILINNSGALPHDVQSAFTSSAAQQLANIFVVGQVFLHTGLEMPSSVSEGSEQIITSEKGVQGLVRVTAPSGSKCDRCWRFLELDEHSLCGRCSQVVEEEFPELGRADSSSS